jgi:hypothetical protein
MVDYRAEVAQLVEHHLAKVRVAGSSPVFRSISLSADRESPDPPIERSRSPPSRVQVKAATSE